MRRAGAIVAGIWWAVSVGAGEAHVLPGTALWLEHVPGTTDVVVVGSFTMESIQGWSFGICHDPAEVSIGTCLGTYLPWCECTHGPRSQCPAVSCPEDLVTYPDHLFCGGYFDASVYENGLTSGVAIMGCWWCLGAEERLELLRISYTPHAETATLRFCETLGKGWRPEPVPNIYVYDGLSYAPERLEAELIISFPLFTRGDANQNGSVEIGDAVTVLSYLFRKLEPPRCLEAADANDDERVNVADGVVILSHLFRNGGPLPEPHGRCGHDPTAGDGSLTCFSFAPCQ